MENNLITAENLPLITDIQKQSFIKSFIEKMGNGEYDVFEMYIQAKQLESMFSELIKHPRVKEILDLEAKNNDPKINRCGFILERASKSNYEYDKDDTYRELKRLLKNRELLLKTIPTDGGADPETGELIYPPLRKVSEFFKLTTKKNK